MPKMMYPQLKEGDSYNDLLVKTVYVRMPAEGSKKKYGRKRFVLECFCGREFDSDAANIMNGHTKSCGCIYKTVTGLPKEKHGMSDTPTWSSWKSMIQRCANPTEREKLYYEGIDCCEEWVLFENFFNDMGNVQRGLHWIVLTLTSGIIKRTVVGLIGLYSHTTRECLQETHRVVQECTGLS